MRRVNSNMLAQELEERRVELRLTVGQLGRFLGVENNNIRRWLEGRKEIPIQVAIIVRLLTRYKLDPRAIYLNATGLELE